MSETFCQDARRLAGKAGRWLGWRPNDFWSATPAELSSIVEPDDDANADAGLNRRDFDKMMERDGNG